MRKGCEILPPLTNQYSHHQLARIVKFSRLIHMREIKFRAWDKHSRVMCDVRMMTFDLRQLFDKNSSGYEVLQFTGLRDKNDKEIYDGDIILCGYRTGIGGLLTRVKGRVHYVESSACFCIEIPWGKRDFISWGFMNY